MIALLLILLSSAYAHAPGLSHAMLEPERITLVVSAEELSTPPEISMRTAEGPCELGAWTRVPVDDGQGWTAPLACGEGERTYTADFFGSVYPGHRHVVTAGAQQAVLSADQPRLVVAGAVAVGSTVRTWLLLGIEHILGGFDHLAFLLALLVGARSLREMMWVVSGFTIGHSLTLTLAALGYVSLPAAIVEPAIAASIVWAGLENLGDPPQGRRIVATLLLGLVHGLGFAGLLSELGLPSTHLLAALFSFHLGVELGQLTVVAVALPLLLAARNNAVWTRMGVPAVSVMLALAGVAWCIERLS